MNYVEKLTRLLWEEDDIWMDLRKKIDALPNLPEKSKKDKKEKQQSEPKEVVYKWPYEEYSSWSKQLAKLNSKKELEKRMNKADSSRSSLSKSHLSAIDKTTSMIGNSQRRAQSRSSMQGNYEEYKACKDALEIYQFYPEKTKDGK